MLPELVVAEVPWMSRARTCSDCYFRRNGLCALSLDAPCPTFRAVVHGRMAAPPQARLVPRPIGATAVADELALA